MEIRMMYVWPEGGELTPVLPLVRMGRGMMMGVDHNKNLEWVGGSAALWVGQEPLQRQADTRKLACHAEDSL